MNRNKRRHFYLLLFAFIYYLLPIAHHLSSCEAAFEFRQTGARGVGLGGAFSAQCTDATAPFWNPAGVRLVPQVEVTSFYTQLFSLTDLRYLGTSFAVPTPFGGIGGGYSQFGPSEFREQQILATHGFQLVDNVFAGYTIKGMFLKIDEFGSASAFGMDAGVLARITENLNLATTAKNLNRPTIGQAKELLPTGFVAGVAFRPIEGLWLTGDFERIDPNPVTLKSGIEFMVAPYFVLRGGVQSQPARFSGGLGARAGIVRLDYAYYQHGTLPGQHEFTITFKFGPFKEEFYEYRAEKGKGKGKSKGKVSELKEKGPKPVKITPVQEPKAPEKFLGKLNLATATVDDLAGIEEIGLLTAGRIVEYRDQSGLTVIDDLLKVPGMHKNMFNVLKERAFIQPVSGANMSEEQNIPSGDGELMEPESYDESSTGSETVAPASAPAEPAAQDIFEEPAPSEPLPAEPAPTEPAPVPAEPVPAKPAPVPAAVPAPAAAAPVPSKKLPNLNRLSPQELSNMGLSSMQIKNILRYRQKKGSFKSLEELQKLPGIDGSTFDKLKDALEVK